MAKNAVTVGNAEEETAHAQMRSITAVNRC